MSFESLLEHFYRTTGIEFKEKRDIINTKISRFYTEKGYSDYHDFFDALKRDKGLHQELVNLLTTSETYFYREFAQLELCIEQTKGLPSIKVLSAPCASGEEPYSILISMLEAGIDLNKIEIYGIDINSQEISNAKNGIFSQRRLHRLPQALQQKYFTALANDKYQIIPRLREHVHFKQLNIFEPFSGELSDFDVIFSRNMLIYFDRPAQEKAEKIFYNRLKNGGILFLGHADQIHHVTALQQSIRQGTRFYQK